MANYDNIFTKDDGNPFDVPDLWRPSFLAPARPAESSFFSLASFKETEGKIEAPLEPKDAEQRKLFPPPEEFSIALPRFTTWPPPPTEQFGRDPASVTTEGTEDSLQQEQASDPASVTTDGTESVLSVVEDEDIWLQSSCVEFPLKSQFHAWDSFFLTGENTSLSPYVTEVGNSAVDAALAQQDGQTGVVVKSDVFCTCLLHLGLGRSSMLFVYDRTTDDFKPVHDKMRVSGCTASTVGCIVEIFAQCGKNIKRLRRFADDVYKESSSANPSIVALAQCVSDVVETVQKRLSFSSRSIRSLLQLDSLIRDPALIVDAFVEITSVSSPLQDDCQLLSRLFDVIQQQQHRSGWLRPLLVETLARVSRPWLEFVEQWVGLTRPLGGVGFNGLRETSSFVQVEETSDVDETGKERLEKTYTLNKDRAPSFMTAEGVETMFETGKSLRFLESFHPDHPLSKPGILESAKAPRLAWKFSWQDLDDVQAQARSYEQRLRIAIEQYTAPQSEIENPLYVHDDPMDIVDAESFSTFGRSKEEISAMIDSSLLTMNEPPSSSPVTASRLCNLVLRLCQDDNLTSFLPPISVIPQLSFSHIIAAQSRLINKVALEMFFKEHHIRDHLSLLRRFLLFGDGIFASRLAHALFDDELDTTERVEGRQRTGGTMGLKLGSRETWPPASSELRLALIGVLTDSLSNTGANIHTAGKGGELPGGLSFAVREMSQEELEKCMDPDSLEALDFLKIFYKPPKPLDAIITPTALYRYDRIFRLLLRILRMVFVVNTLFKSSLTQKEAPEATRFRLEATHFVNCVAAYTLDSGIGTTWVAFERKLDELEASVEADTEPGTEQEGLDRLRAYHESTLDRIMFATLCHKRQAPVMRLVEEIFGVVLKFACKRANRAPGGEAASDMNQLYTSFRRRVGIFISVCRGLSEKRGYGQGGKDETVKRAVEGLFGSGYREEENNMLQMLLVRLEMTGYYSETGARAK